MRKIRWAKEYGVRARDLQPVMRGALLIVAKAYDRQNKELTVTSTGGGDHSVTSFHPWGYAFDCRIWYLTKRQKTQIVYDVRQMFKGTDYQIVWEKDHFHIEWDNEEWRAKYD